MKIWTRILALALAFVMIFAFTMSIGAEELPETNLDDEVIEGTGGDVVVEGGEFTESTDDEITDGTEEEITDGTEEEITDGTEEEITGGNESVRPMFRVNSETGEMEVSYDNGATWESTGVKSETPVASESEDDLLLDVCDSFADFCYAIFRFIGMAFYVIWDGIYGLIMSFVPAA